MGWQEDEIVAAPESGEASSAPPIVRAMGQIGEAAVDWLPAIGGTVGGVLGSAGGPLGTAGGAGLGAAGGEAFRQLLKPEDAPTTSLGAAEDIMASGALGAVGGSIPAARGIPGKLLKFAVSPTGGAVIGGADAARRGGGPVEIAAEAALVATGAKQLGGKIGAARQIAKAIKLAEVKAAEAQVRHAAKQVEKVLPMPKTPARAIPVAKPANVALDLDAVEARVLQLRGQGLSPGQIAESLREEIAPGAADVGVKRVRTLTDTILKKYDKMPDIGYRGTKPSNPQPAPSLQKIVEAIPQEVQTMRRLGIDDTDIAKTLAAKYRPHFEHGQMTDETAYQMVKMVP